MRFFNQKGNTLIQVVVASALLGIISMGFMTMLSQMSQAQRIAEARQDLVSLTNDMQTNFSVDTVCTQNLVSSQAFSFDQAKAQFPPAAGASFAYNGQPFKFKLASDTLQDGAKLSTYKLTANKIQIVNAVDTMKQDSSGNEIYKINVIGQLSPQNYDGHGLSDFSARQLASGYITVGSGSIVTCSATDPSLSVGRNPAQVTGGTTGTPLTSDQIAQVCSAFNGTYANGMCAISGTAGATGAAGGMRYSPIGGAPTCKSNVYGSVAKPPGTACSSRAAAGAPCTTAGEKCWGATSTVGSNLAICYQLFVCN